MSEALRSADLRERVEAAAHALRDAGVRPAQVGWIAPTGSAPLAPHFEAARATPLASIAGFPSSFAEATLLHATLGGRTIAAVEGGAAPHAGGSLLETVFPVWVLKALGAEVLLLTAAGGSLDPSLAPGEILLVVDHLNLPGEDPLLGLADPSLGPLFPDLSLLYDARLRARARRLARDGKLALRAGAVAFRRGPSLETRAERRVLRSCGAIAVVHSLVPEAIAAAHAGLPVVALVAVTDAAHADAGGLEVGAMARAASLAEPRLGTLLSLLLREVLP